ncbi:MAG: hypothetical protein KKH28_08195, partial [Elusimicrobia bacterium]|nr:hypothetical protein [Elusimicrobiota bacterium]
MTNWKIYTLVAVVVTAAGFGYVKSSHRNIPSDFRDAVADNRDFNTAIPVFDKDSGNIPVPTVVAEKISAAADPESVHNASNSGITYSKGFQVMVAERERAEQAVRAVKSKFGDDIRKDKRLYEAYGRYQEAEVKQNVWVAVLRFGLVAGKSDAS